MGPRLHYNILESKDNLVNHYFLVLAEFLEHCKGSVNIIKLINKTLGLSKHFLEKFMLRTSTIRIIIMITNML
jgi:hypothetical protein